MAFFESTAAAKAANVLKPGKLLKRLSRNNSNDRLVSEEAMTPKDTTNFDGESVNSASTSSGKGSVKGRAAKLQNSLRTQVDRVKSWPSRHKAKSQLKNLNNGSESSFEVLDSTTSSKSASTTSLGASKPKMEPRSAGDGTRIMTPRSESLSSTPSRSYSQVKKANEASRLTPESSASLEGSGIFEGCLKRGRLQALLDHHRHTMTYGQIRNQESRIAARRNEKPTRQVSQYETQDLLDGVSRKLALEPSAERQAAEKTDPEAQRSRILQELQDAEKLQTSPKDPISEEEAAQLAQASREKVKSGLSEGQVYGDQFWSRTGGDKIMPADSTVRKQRGGFALRDDIQKSGKEYSKRAYNKAHWHDRLLPEVRKTVDRTTTSVDDLMALHAQQQRLMSQSEVSKMTLEEFESELAAFEAKTSPKAKQQLLTTYSGGPYGSSWTPRDSLMDKRRDAFQKSAEDAFKKEHEGEEWSSDSAVRKRYREAEHKHWQATHKAAYEKYPTTSPLEFDKDGKLQVVSHTYEDIGHQTGPKDTKSSFDFFSGIGSRSFERQALEAEGLSERDYSSYALKRRGQISNEADMRHQQALQKLWNSPKNIDPEKLKLAAQAQQDLEKYPEWQQAVASVEKGESNNTNHWFIKNWPGIDHRAVKLWQTTYENSPNGIYERVVKARSNPSRYASDQEYT